MSRSRMLGRFGRMVGIRIRTKFLLVAAISALLTIVVAAAALDLLRTQGHLLDHLSRDDLAQTHETMLQWEALSRAHVGIFSLLSEAARGADEERIYEIGRSLLDAIRDVSEKIGQLRIEFTGEERLRTELIDHLDLYLAQATTTVERAGMAPILAAQLMIDASADYAAVNRTFRAFVEESRRSVDAHIGAVRLETRQKLSLLFVIVGSAMIGSLGLSFLLARVVTTPLVDLAHLMTRVSRTGDYHLRAEKRTADEVGDLVDGFNAMLEQIERGRGELTQINEQLRSEVAQRRRAEEVAAHRQREAEVLAGIVGNLNASLGLETVLQEVVGGARELCASDVAAVALWDPHTETMQVRHEAGGSGEQLGLTVESGKGIGGQVLLTGRPYRTDNYVEDPGITKDYLSRARREGVVTAIALPIRGPDRLDGLLYVINRSPRPFGDRDESVLSRLADHTSIALRNAQLLEALQEEIEQRRHAQELSARAREEADRANQAKSEFLSRMSHELRTPLNAILGFAQLLEMASLPPTHRESVAYILRGGRHLLELINEVLDIGRIEADRLALSPEPVCAREALTESLELIRSAAAAKQIQLRANDPAADRHVWADRQRLRQVLLNLLSNAVKYNREGGTLTVVCEESDEERLRIRVIDTGPGIPTEKMPRLFTPFDRLGAEQLGIEGTGLGLVLSKRLVEAMGGTLGAESVVGQGSTFWVELAIVEAPARRFDRLRAGMTPDEIPDVAGTLLYIEDNLSNLALVERILADRPHVKLLSAMQGTLGLELAREHHPALILLDLNLPDMSGAEVLRRLREDPRTRSSPIVVISADATPGLTQRLLAAGARAYLTKPLDVRQFLDIVDETLAGTRR